MARARFCFKCRTSHFLAGHAPTDYERWLQAEAPYDVTYAERYAPYVIGARAWLPRYDERFHGYGRAAPRRRRPRRPLPRAARRVSDGDRRRHSAQRRARAAFRGSAAHPLQKLRLEEFYAKVAKAELAPYSLASSAADAKPRALPPLLRPVKPI